MLYQCFRGTGAIGRGCGFCDVIGQGRTVFTQACRIAVRVAAAQVLGLLHRGLQVLNGERPAFHDKALMVLADGQGMSVQVNGGVLCNGHLANIRVRLNITGQCILTTSCESIFPDGTR